MLRRASSLDLAGAVGRRSDELARWRWASSGPTSTSWVGCPATRSARQLREHITGAGVQLDLATESSQATSIAVVSLDEEGVASYTFHFTDTANFGWQADDLPTLAADDWLHIASLSCVVSPGARRAAGLDARGDLRRLVRHQRAADGHHRPGGVLGQGAAVAAGGRAATAASSRPATRTSSSWPRSAASPARPGRRRSPAGSSSTGSAWPWSPSGPAAAAAVEPGRSGSPGSPASRPRSSTPSAPATPSWPGSWTARSTSGWTWRTSLRRGAAAASIVCSRRGAQPPTSAEVDALIEEFADWAVRLGLMLDIEHVFEYHIGMDIGGLKAADAALDTFVLGLDRW